MSYLDISMTINKDVLRLKITIDDVQIVQVLKAKYNLRCIEPRMSLTVHMCVCVFMCV